MVAVNIIVEGFIQTPRGIIKQNGNTHMMTSFSKE